MWKAATAARIRCKAMQGTSAAIVTIGAQIADLRQFAFVNKAAGAAPVINGFFVNQLGNIIGATGVYDGTGVPFTHAVVADTVYTWRTFFNLAYGVSLATLPLGIAGVIFATSGDLSYCIGNPAVTKAQLQGKGPTWTAALNRALGQVG